MRCLSCDVILTPFEATRKYRSSGEYMELCNKCFAPIEGQVPVVVRHDLMEYDDRDDNERWWNEDEDNKE